MATNHRYPIDDDVEVDNDNAVSNPNWSDDPKVKALLRYPKKASSPNGYYFVTSDKRQRSGKNVFDSLRDKREWIRHGPVSRNMVDLFLMHLDLTDEPNFFKHGCQVEEGISNFIDMIHDDYMKKTLARYRRLNTVPLLDPDYAKMAFTVRAAWKAWYGYGASGPGYEFTDFLMQHTLGQLLGWMDKDVHVNGEMLGLYQGTLARIRHWREMENRELGVPEHEQEEQDTPVTAQQVTVYIEDEVLAVPLEDILSCFWTKRLDTVCNLCGGTFLEEPPTRTIVPHESKSADASNLNVRVVNRHSVCLEAAEVVYVPVSHIWHDSVREANGSGAYHQEAARALIDTVAGLFKGARMAYRPGTEFWHDYFSVPQWEQKTRDQLLLRLPIIYNQADEILVHLADLRACYVESLLLGAESGVQTDSASDYHELSLAHAVLAFPALIALQHSEWMKRMWVMIEYNRSKRACIMDQSNFIVRSVEDDGVLFCQDSFTKLMLGVGRHTWELYRYTSQIPHDFRLFCRSIMCLPGRSDEKRFQELGEALELVNSRQAHLLRDRVIAIHLLISEDTRPIDYNEFPQDIGLATTLVWASGLRRHDYSVLLLQPREDVPGSNPPPGCTSFVYAPGNLKGLEFNLKRRVTPALRPIELFDGGFHIEVDLLGTIESIQFLAFDDAETVAGVKWAITLLESVARRKGTPLLAQGLFDGLNRVFSFHLMDREWPIDFSFQSLQERDDDFEERLQEKLVCWQTCPEDGVDSVVRLGLAEEIREIMSFTEFFNNGEEFPAMRDSRWNTSLVFAARRQRRGCTRGEPICEVRCPQCRVVTLYRLDLRTSAKMGDKVYRIPGLQYLQTEKDAVGLVINEDGEITGRKFLGTPLCDCVVIEKVRLH